MTNPLRQLSALAGLSLVFFYLGLGSYDLSAPDEPRYALVAREMLTDAHWLVLHRNQIPYPDKPPLFFWAIAGLSAAAGGTVTPWTARLPSALAATVILLLMWQWSQDANRSRWLPVVTVLVLMSCVKFFFQARMVQIDMLLTLFTTGALIIGFKALSGKPYSPFWLGICLGAAILAKGPVGLLIPIGSMCFFALLTGRETWKKMPLKGFLWGLLLPLVWLLALLVDVSLHDQWAYLNNLLFKQTVTRYFNAWVHHRPFYYFLVTFQHDFLPWTPFLWLVIPFSKKKWAGSSQQQKYAWAVIVFTLVFFSLSKGKRGLYILPVFPFAAYLTATRIVSYFEKGTIDKWAKGAWSLSGLIILAVGLAGVVAASGQVTLPLNWIKTPLPVLWLASLGGMLVLLAATVFYSIWTDRVKGAFAAIVAAMALASFLMYSVLMPWVSPYRSARSFMTRADQIIHSRAGTPVIGMVRYRSAFRFYGDFPLEEMHTCQDLTPFWIAHPSGWVIIRDKELKSCERTWTHKIKIHVRQRLGRGHDYLLISLNPTPDATGGKKPPEPEINLQG